LLGGGEVGLVSPGSELFVPNGAPPSAALARTTDLGIGAHADDLELLAYRGIEDCFEREDRWFTGVVVADGVGGPSLAGGPDGAAAAALGARRRAEQRAAAQVGRYGAVVQLARPSAELKDPARAAAVVDDLERLLLATRPATVYLHNPADRHDTHVAVLARAVAALRRLPDDARPRRVLGVEVWRDLDWLCAPDRVALPVGARPHLQRALVGLFDSQIASGKRYDLAVEGRRTAHATFAESHEADSAPGLCLALDLTAACRPDGPGLADLVEGALDRLRDDVRARLARTGGL
jgi:LmbE family N-acetylglucosaminyl deacetylase